MFLYELHCHTAEGSRCASVNGADLALQYVEKGYKGVAITDHFYGGNTAASKDNGWETWVDGLAKGFENCKKVGEPLGLKVFFGWEYYDRGTEFLTYGLSKEWLKVHPELAEVTVEEYCKIIKKAGGILIHAHPFRIRNRLDVIRLLPQWSDGVETVNKGNDPKANYMAEQYAENFGLIPFGGTDLHNKSHFSRLGGVALPVEVSSIQELFDEAERKTIRIL